MDYYQDSFTISLPLSSTPADPPSSQSAFSPYNPRQPILVIHEEKVLEGLRPADDKRPLQPMTRRDRSLASSPTRLVANSDTSSGREQCGGSGRPCPTF